MGFPGISRRTHGGNGLKLCMLMYLDHFQNWLVYGDGLLIFSCDQAALWMVQSICPSVCPSVTPFSPCSHHRIIMKFPGVISNDKSDVHETGQGQRSKVKVKTQFTCFWTITQVRIHIWRWNDAQSLMLLRRGALLFFKVIRQIWRSHGTKNSNFDPNRVFLHCNLSLSSQMDLKWCPKLNVV